MIKVPKYQTTQRAKYDKFTICIVVPHRQFIMTHVTSKSSISMGTLHSCQHSATYFHAEHEKTCGAKVIAVLNTHYICTPLDCPLIK